MMKQNRFSGVLLFFIFTSIVACGKKISKESSESLFHLFDSLDYSYDTNSKKNILIIPAEGCSGCIDESIVWATTQDTVLLSVFITALTEKTILLNADSLFFKKQNVIMDKRNLSGKILGVTSYPEAFFLDKGRLVKRVLINPQESSLSIHEMDLFLD